MKKFLAILCFAASSILLGAYFESKDLGQVTPLHKELCGLSTKVFVSLEDISCFESTGRYDEMYGNVRLFFVDEYDGTPYILVSTPHSAIEEGKTYAINPSKEVAMHNGENFQVFSLSEPQKHDIAFAILSGLFILLCVGFILWDRSAEVKEFHKKVSE